MRRRLPLVHAVAWIVGSALFISGGSYSLLRGVFKYQRMRRFDPSFFLSRIVQTGPQKEALSTLYLAELLQLSADKPLAIAYFDAAKAQKQIESSPVVQSASVKAIEPDTIYVDYTVRQPLAWLYDFENAAIDEEGVIFPVFPFFSPKTLPEVYLGIDKAAWGQKIEGKKIDLALALLSALRAKGAAVKRIDVSKMFLESLGQREIVVVLHYEGSTHALRLSAKEYAQGMGNYFELRGRLAPKPHIIDLRIPQLGYVEEGR